MSGAERGTVLMNESSDCPAAGVLLKKTSCTGQFPPRCVDQSRGGWREVVFACLSVELLLGVYVAVSLLEESFSFGLHVESVFNLPFLQFELD